MCVLAFAWRAHPRWRLVAIGNRDELHDRPASPLAHWDDPDHLLAGRDLQSGGIWLGVSEQGRFAVVTNLRGFGEPQPGRPSRGELTSGFLTGSQRPEEIDAAAFNPFNLLLADRDGAYFVSNRPHPVHAALAPGLYGLSNAALDEPWPKTLRLKEALLHWLIDDNGDPAALLPVLREETLPATGLRDATPSDVPLEPAISPPFIRNPLYGTRCSTVVTIDNDGQGVMIERRFTRDAGVEGEMRLAFAWA